MNARRGPLVAGLLAAAILAQACRLPDINEEQALAEPLPLTSFLYAADLSLITRFHAEQDRVLVPFEKIPQSIRDAVVAVEDKRFYEHRGIDAKAILRAAYVNYSNGRVVEGGSTITQQYIKNAVVGAERSLSRKWREAILAWQLEDDLSKQEILTRYLNTVYFGEGAYGIQSAAKTYFSRPVWELTLAQSALLAGLIASPGDYDPFKRPAEALARRNQVLDRMLELGMVDRHKYDWAVKRKLGLTLTVEDERYIAPYFVDHVKRWFLNNPRFGDTYTQRYNLLFKGGLRIYTTLDPSLQRSAEEAISDVLAYPTDPYGAMTVIDPRTGHIKAMVGGRDFFSETNRFAKVNLATGDGGTGRQTGSAFKTFALVAALERGIPPQRVYNAPSSITFPMPAGSDPPYWSPQNYEGSYYGPITLEQATVYSVNVAYALIERDIGRGDLFTGAARVVEVAKRMGIRSDLAAVPSAVLGANSVTPLDMASAYGPLATGGYYAPPIAVTRIEDADGNVLYQAPDRNRRVVDPAIAYVANQILQKVILFGTGAAANIGRPAFGKTGTGQQWRDAWFVGGIPQLVAAVWVGFPQGQVQMAYPRVRIAHVTGGSWPAQIWRTFMLRATDGMRVRGFPRPEVVSFVTVDMDVTRGCVANDFTPPDLIESFQFVSGTEPTEVCSEPSTYQLLDVPSVIGLAEDEARTALEEAGFAVEIEREPSDQPLETVIAQDPAPGEQALHTSAVTVTVAAAPLEQSAASGVPDVIGLAEDEAVRLLQAAGFGVAIFEEPECDPDDPACDFRAGVVWKERPPPGSVAGRETTITIWVNP